MELSKFDYLPVFAFFVALNILVTLHINRFVFLFFLTKVGDYKVAFYLLVYSYIICIFFAEKSTPELVQQLFRHDLNYQSSIYWSSYTSFDSP